MSWGKDFSAYMDFFIYLFRSILLLNQAVRFPSAVHFEIIYASKRVFECLNEILSAKIILTYV